MHIGARHNQKQCAVLGFYLGTIFPHIDFEYGNCSQFK